VGVVILVFVPSNSTEVFIFQVISDWHPVPVQNVILPDRAVTVRCSYDIIQHKPTGREFICEATVLVVIKNDFSISKNVFNLVVVDFKICSQERAISYFEVNWHVRVLVSYSVTCNVDCKVTLVAWEETHNMAHCVMIEDPSIQLHFFVRERWEFSQEGLVLHSDLPAINGAEVWV